MAIDAREFLSELDGAHKLVTGLVRGANALLWTSLDQEAIELVAKYRDGLETRKVRISAARDALQDLIDAGYPEMPAKPVGSNAGELVKRGLADMQALADVLSAVPSVPAPEPTTEPVGDVPIEPAPVSDPVLDPQPEPIGATDGVQTETGIVEAKAAAE
jgi:hypothetical protein